MVNYKDLGLVNRFQLQHHGADAGYRAGCC